MGKIPKSLLRIEALKHASFRVYRLCGKIPQGRTYNIFCEDTYADNLCLCAKPLPPCTSKYYTQPSVLIFFKWDLVVSIHILNICRRNGIKLELADMALIVNRRVKITEIINRWIKNLDHLWEMTTSPSMNSRKVLYFIFWWVEESKLLGLLSILRKYHSICPT